MKDPLLLVTSPLRYLDGEVNAVHKDFDKASVRVALAFPDLTLEFEGIRRRQPPIRRFWPVVLFVRNTRREQLILAKRPLALGVE